MPRYRLWPNYIDGHDWYSPVRRGQHYGSSQPERRSTSRQCGKRVCNGYHTHAASEVSAGTFTGNYLFTGSTSDPPVRIRPHASAATIADFENSSGTVKAYVDTSGNIVSSSSLRSQVATGQAPIVVDSSTTACTNLNADMVDGYNASDFVLKSSTNYTAGVLLQGTGAGNLLAPLALGTSGQVLTATSGTGLTWTTPSAGGGSGATSATVEFSAPSLFSVGTNGASLLNLGDATTARMCRGFDDTTNATPTGLSVFRQISTDREPFRSPLLADCEARRPAICFGLSESEKQQTQNHGLEHTQSMIQRLLQSLEQLPLNVR